MIRKIMISFIFCLLYTNCSFSQLTPKYSASRQGILTAWQELVSNSQYGSVSDSFSINIKGLRDEIKFFTTESEKVNNYSEEQIRILKRIIQEYEPLEALSQISQKDKRFPLLPFIIYYNFLHSLLALNQDVLAAFEYEVPDNKVLSSSLVNKINIMTQKIADIIEGNVESINNTIENRIKHVVDTLFAIITPLGQQIDYANNKLDELLNRKDTVSFCLGLAYYSSGVVSGWATWRPFDSLILTVTGEVLDYHEPITSTSHIGIKLGIGGLIAKRYNISIGGILFDSTLNPNGEGSIAHRISISLDYWRSKDISLGVGYSPLTGLGGRVLLGL